MAHVAVELGEVAHVAAAVVLRVGAVQAVRHDAVGVEAVDDGVGVQRLLVGVDDDLVVLPHLRQERLGAFVVVVFGLGVFRVPGARRATQH